MAITDNLDQDGMGAGINVKIEEKEKSQPHQFSNESVKQAVSQMNITPHENQFAVTGDFKVQSKTPAPVSKL